MTDSRLRRLSTEAAVAGDADSRLARLSTEAAVVALPDSRLSNLSVLVLVGPAEPPAGSWQRVGLRHRFL